jgi:hypothetical protein
MCSLLFDRKPISRDRDCYGLTEISEISGGRQRFVLRQRFYHFEAWQAGISGQYSTGESPPIKAGHRKLPPHLESTCTRFNTSSRRRTRPSAGPERSQQLQIPPSLNSKAILQRVRLLFLLRQHFCRCQHFSIHQRFWIRQVFSIHRRFWIRQVFSIRQRFWIPQVFNIRQRFWIRQVFSIRQRFWTRQAFSICQRFWMRQVFSIRQHFWMRQCFLYILQCLHFCIFFCILV